MDLRSCAFVGNQASGGAVFTDAGSGLPGSGGAIHNSGTVTLDLCTLAGNSATGGSGVGTWPVTPGGPGGEGSGGAIFNQGTLTVDRTTLCGNTATGGGGGAGGTAAKRQLHSGRLSWRSWRWGERRRDLQLGLVAGSPAARLSVMSSPAEPAGTAGGGMAVYGSMAGTGAAAGMEARASVGRCSIAGRRAWSTAPLRLTPAAAVPAAAAVRALRAGH